MSAKQNAQFELEPLARLFDQSIGDASIVFDPLSRVRDDARNRARRRGFNLDLGPNLLVTGPFVDSATSAAGSRDVTVQIALGAVHAEFGPNPLAAKRAGDTVAYELTLRAKGDTREPVPLTLPLSPEGVHRPQPGRMSSALFGPGGDKYVWAIGHWSDWLVANLLSLAATTSVLRSNQIGRAHV